MRRIALLHGRGQAGEGKDAVKERCEQEGGQAGGSGIEGRLCLAFAKQESSPSEVATRHALAAVCEAKAALSLPPFLPSQSMNLLSLLSTLQGLLAEIISALSPPHPQIRPSDKMPSAESRERGAAAEASARRMDAPLRKNPSTPSLHDFQRLPHHIQAYIITMACRLPALHAQEPQRKGRPVVQRDAKTARSLALVSKEINGIVSRPLFEDIHVARPSTLRLLVTAVVGRPALGKFIRALHIGPDAALPSDWLPIHQLKWSSQCRLPQTKVNTPHGSTRPTLFPSTADTIWKGRTMRSNLFKKLCFMRARSLISTWDTKADVD